MKIRMIQLNKSRISIHDSKVQEVDYTLTKECEQLRDAILPILRWAISKKGTVIAHCSCSMIEKGKKIDSANLAQGKTPKQLWKNVSNNISGANPALVQRQWYPLAETIRIHMPSKRILCIAGPTTALIQSAIWASFN